MEHIKALSALDSHDQDHFGGKAANLGEMIKMEDDAIKVPAGFAISTNSFDLACGVLIKEFFQFIKKTNKNPDENASSLRRVIQHSHMPKALYTEIMEAYHHFIIEGSVAVRSSAKGEDSLDHSFAGMSDTILNCPLRQLIPAIKQVWASIFTDRIVAYRQAFYLPVGSMGVVIQRMISAKSAGVIFTADPRDISLRREKMLIEASWGLGESVVSGQLSPDQFLIDRNTGAITHRRVEKKIQQSTVNAGPGIRKKLVPTNHQEVPCLEDHEIMFLTRTARAIEDHFGTPQDIEFAIEHETNKCWILQSRPIVFT